MESQKGTIDRFMNRIHLLLKTKMTKTDKQYLIKKLNECVKELKK